jgi:hypothetical protein
MGLRPSATVGEPSSQQKRVPARWAAMNPLSEIKLACKQPIDQRRLAKPDITGRWGVATVSNLIEVRPVIIAIVIVPKRKTCRISGGQHQNFGLGTRFGSRRSHGVNASSPKLLFGVILDVSLSPLVFSFDVAVDRLDGLLAVELLILKIERHSSDSNC